MPRLVAVVAEVVDPGRTAAFYAAAFGIELHAGADNERQGDPWTGGEHQAVTWTDGAFLHLSFYRAREAPTAGLQLGFRVDDLEAAHARAVDAGAEVLHPPRDEPWGRSARYRDPDGNVVELTSPPPAGRGSPGP